MEKTTVTVPWTSGLHMLPAARIVHLAKRFSSRIQLRVGSKVAEATSVLSIMLLCAALNTPLEVEASGADEKDAVEAIQLFFKADGDSADVPAKEQKWRA